MDTLEEFDYLFLSYFSRTPWWDYGYSVELIKLLANKKRDQERAFHLLLECVTLKKKIIVFGAGSILVKCLQELLSIDNYNGYFLDNNTILQGGEIDGIRIYAPDKIRSENIGSFLLIVLSKRYYSKIKNQLEGYGLQEYQDFIDGQILIDDEHRFPIKI